MSRKEVPRAGVVKAALAGKITNGDGARALDLSTRQFKRLKARMRAEGVRGLLHRRRGQASPRRLAADLRAQVIALMTTTYDGFNDSHLTEKLQEQHALPVSRATVRRVRLSLGRPPRHRRRAPKHRRRRDRAPALGQLAQLDASPHAWLEARGPRATLHGVIDDATSMPLALWFRPTEDLHGYLTVLGHVCRTYGLPVTLYGDRLTLFMRNDQHWTLDEELRGRQDPTHFGHVLAELGIGFIQAQSPQAKGRIERLWGTLQDRLVSELRLRGIATLAAANAFLPEFLADFAPRFAAPAAQPTPAWRPAPRDLDHVLSCRYHRTVATDNTIRIGGRWMQLPPGPRQRSYARCRVEVRELLDGRLVARYQNRLVATQACPHPDFVLTPRRTPGAPRRQQQRRQRQRAAQLARAVTALGELGRAAAPASSSPRLPASRNADRPAGRPDRMAQNGKKWVPAPEHPWHRAFTRRGRELQRTPKG